MAPRLCAALLCVPGPCPGVPALMSPCSGPCVLKCHCACCICVLMSPSAPAHGSLPTGTPAPCSRLCPRVLKCTWGLCSWAHVPVCVSPGAPAHVPGSLSLPALTCCVPAVAPHVLAPAGMELWGPASGCPCASVSPCTEPPWWGPHPCSLPTLGTPPHTPSSRGKEVSQQEEGHGKQQHPCPRPLPARPSAQACHEKHLLYCPRYSAARPFPGVLGGSPSPLACVSPSHPPSHHDGTPP